MRQFALLLVTVGLVPVVVSAQNLGSKVDPPKLAAVTLPDGVSKGVTVEGLTEYKLKNGLRVLLLPDSSQPKVTVNCTILAGSRHEGYGETGMAHLIEHMVFKGCPKSYYTDLEKQVDQLQPADVKKAFDKLFDPNCTFRNNLEA
jgi:predicted Zn-dependent peptidase